MKNLKLGLFSILAILAVSVFLTSCEQEDVLPDIATDSIEQIDLEATPQTENTLNIWLPESVISQGEEATQTYISSMTLDELSTAAKDLIIIDYLHELDKLNDFKIQIQENGTLQGVDLSESLSENNLSNLNSKLNMISNDEISYRCDVVCVKVYYWYNWTYWWQWVCY